MPKKWGGGGGGLELITYLIGFRQRFSYPVASVHMEVKLNYEYSWN